MANIPGTPSYWHNNMEDVKAIFNDFGCPTVFWTLSCPTYHCPYLHELLGIPHGSSYEVIDQSLRANPHIVNEFFTKKVKEFTHEFLENYLHCVPEYGGWYWDRYEWQFRDAIHAHGLAKFGKTDFDVCTAADVCIASHVASLKPKKI